MSAVVYPLYGSLPPKDKQRVFPPTKSPNQRKIIVATNIAETSLTIDGVVYVVDPGFVKQSQYRPDRKMSSLLVTPISQAAATQRSGRAGRTRPGKCYRLYTESSFANQLPAQTIPEIKRSDLTGVILTMLATGIRDIVNFPFIDPPPAALMAGAVEELFHLGAIDGGASLTEIGRLMSTLPVEPKHGKALIGARRFGCTEEMAVLVALLSEQGQTFVRPRDRQNAADLAHSQFRSGWGDHLSLLRAYEAFVGNGSSKGWCEENFLNYRVLSRAESARGQLIGLLRKQEIEIVGIEKDNPDRAKFLLRGILEGMFMQVAMLNESSASYLFVNGLKEASIHPSSCMRRKPKWIVYDSYIFTNKDYVRTVSEVLPGWLFEASPSFFDVARFSDGLVKRALRVEKDLIDEQNKYK
jgi:pre-mRNA-splicing factor ATP-dependent RNA helicase DHX15/PRP43